MENLLPDIVKRNIRAYRLQAGLTHKAVADALAAQLGTSPCRSQSQSNERSESLSYARLGALAIIFGTEPAHFFMERPPDLLQEAAKLAAAAPEADPVPIVVAVDEGPIATGDGHDAD